MENSMLRNSKWGKFVVFYSLTILFIIFQKPVLSQSPCQDYFINELISGTDEKCELSPGTPLNFCRRMKGISINRDLLFDVSKWEGYDTQYLTLIKNGGIAGSMTLKLIEKELVVTFMGCGGTNVYSISSSEDEYNSWLEEKPLREKQKAENLLNEQKQKEKEKLKAEKINQIIEKHNLKSYYKEVDSALVNPIIRKNEKFRKILEVCNVDTFIIEFKDGQLSRINNKVFSALDAYCEKCWQLQRVGTHLEGMNKQYLSSSEKAKIQEQERDIYFTCKSEKTAVGFRSFQLLDLFSSYINKDTLIEGYRIPINSRITIFLNQRPDSLIDDLYIPSKWKDKKLYFAKESFSDKKYKWDGYFSEIKTQNFEEDFKNVRIQYSDYKYVVIQKSIFSKIYANNIYVGTRIQPKARAQSFYKYKKIKT
jgi:hypothetical protein